jgi:hypothetical protein
MHLSNPDRVDSFLEEILPTTRLSYSESEDGRLVVEIHAPGSHDDLTWAFDPDKATFTLLSGELR